MKLTRAKCVESGINFIQRQRSIPTGHRTRRDRARRRRPQMHGRPVGRWSIKEL